MKRCDFQKDYFSISYSRVMILMLEIVIFMHLISLKNNKWSYIGLLEYSVLMWLRFLQQVWNPFYPAGIVRTESASVRC